MTRNLKATKYYLKTTVEEFYDGHGEDTEGSRNFEVILDTDLSESDKFIVENYLNEWVFHDDSGDFNEECKERGILIDEDQVYFKSSDFDEEDRELYAQDGYHCREDSYKFKEITVDQFENFFDAIKSYDEMYEFSNQ